MEQWNYNCSSYSSLGPNSSIITNSQSSQSNSFNHAANSAHMPANSYWNPGNYNVPHQQIGQHSGYGPQAIPLEKYYQSAELTEQQKWVKLTQQRKIDQEFLNEFCKSRGQFSITKQEPIVKVFFKIKNYSILFIRLT